MSEAPNPPTQAIAPAKQLPTENKPLPRRHYIQSSTAQHSLQPAPEQEKPNV